MFFLGGFNTILPHLLYLSLIWAFMIIGLSGRLNFSWPDRVFHNENYLDSPVATHLQDQDGAWLQGYADLTESIKVPFISFSIITVYPENKTPEKYCRVGSVDCRAPPLL